jgi:hypothetical protein
VTVVRTWLVVKADASVRLRTKRPTSRSLAIDEVAIPIAVHIPEGWGEVVDDQIDIHLPDPPSFEPVDDPIIVGEPDEPESEDES